MEQRLSLRYWTRRPKVLLIAAIILAVLVNLILLLGQTWPGAMNNKEARNQLVEAQRQLEELVPPSNAIQVSEEEIQQLLQEVPTFILVSDVIQRLIGKAGESEVFILPFRQPIDHLLSNRSLEADLDAFSRSQNGASPIEEQSIFKSDKFEITAVGSLPKLIHFFDLVASEDIVTVIEKWEITELMEIEAEGIPELTDKKGNYRLIMNYNLYSIPTFQAVFGGEPRTEYSFEQVLNELQSRYPDLRSLQSIAREGGKDGDDS